MFKRRQKLTLFQSLKNLILPARGFEAGWDRRVIYYRHRLFRNADSTHKITAGVAIGIAISFSPFLGTHIFIAMFLCWVFRVNVFAGVIGTMAGNPWTFPPMFWLDYKLGAFLFQFFGVGEIVAMPDTLTLEYLFQNPLKLFLPLTLGGFICSLICWPVAYLACYLPVKGMRRAYRYQRIRAQRAKRFSQH